MKIGDCIHSKIPHMYKHVQYNHTTGEIINIFHDEFIVEVIHHDGGKSIEFIKQEFAVYDEQLTKARRYIKEAEQKYLELQNKQERSLRKQYTHEGEDGFQNPKG